MFGAARHDELSLPPEMLNISSDGRWTGGEQHGEVFITEQSVLVVGFFCDACESVSPEANVFSCRLTSGHCFVDDLSC